MRYRATQKLIEAIKQGVFKADASSEIKRYVPYFECLVAIGSNYNLTLSIDADAITNNPDYFEVIDE